MDMQTQPKDFMTLTKELTWHAMQEIVKGEPLHSVITGVMLTTKDWVEDQVQDNKPFTEVMDELAKLREENQTLRTGAVEQAKTTEGLKKKLADTDALRESYYLENHRLRNDLELQIAENDGLRQAPEVLKREMNALVQDIAKQRDELRETLDQVYKEKDKMQRQLTNELAREQGVHILTKRQRDEAWSARDYAQEKLAAIEAVLQNDGQGE